MTLLCRLVSHRWKGCKCARCGQTRNAEHEWTHKGYCTFICQRCGARRDEPHDWKRDRCTRCGESRYVSAAPAQPHVNRTSAAPVQHYVKRTQRKLGAYAKQCPRCYGEGTVIDKKSPSYPRGEIPNDVDVSKICKTCPLCGGDRSVEDRVHKAYHDWQNDWICPKCGGRNRNRSCYPDCSNCRTNRPEYEDRI